MYGVSIITAQEAKNLSENDRLINKLNKVYKLIQNIALNSNTDLDEFSLYERKRTPNRSVNIEVMFDISEKVATNLKENGYKVKKIKSCYSDCDMYEVSW